MVLSCCCFCLCAFLSPKGKRAQVSGVHGAGGLGWSTKTTLKVLQNNKDEHNKGDEFASRSDNIRFILVMSLSSSCVTACPVGLHWSSTKHVRVLTLCVLILLTTP